MPDIVYFEVPANDVERAKKFYSELFAWEFSKIPEDDYWMIKTGGEDAVGGGLMKRMQPQQTITSYIDVESIRECAPRVENAGGKIIVPRTPVKGMGWFAICLDPELNAFGLWESDEKAK